MGNEAPRSKLRGIRAEASETGRTERSSKEKTHPAAKVVEWLVNIVEATYSPNSKKKSIPARNPSTNLSCLDLLLMKPARDGEKGFCCDEAAPNLLNFHSN